jgi:D-alanine--poly(phosphoribitol) ligase subunit 2
MITQSQQHVAPPPDPHVAPPRAAGIESKVHRIFREGLELDVDVDTDVIEEGLLDSLAFVQLLLALEEEFGIKVDLADLELDQFSTVSNIARLVSTNGNGTP